MDITFANATPELKSAMHTQWESNASDFIHFDIDCFSLVAMAGDRPVGLIVAKRRGLAEPLQTVHEVFIDVIEVQPELRKRGIGTALVQGVIAWAREKQVAQVRAWSEAIRYEALMLWEKLGFTFSRVDFERQDGKHYGFYVTIRV